MRNTSFHQANQVSQFKSDFTAMRYELVSSINILADARNTDLEATEATLAATTTPPPPPTSYIPQQ